VCISDAFLSLLTNARRNASIVFIRSPLANVATEAMCSRRSTIQGGRAKVKPTYIFAGNIILVTFECIGEIQWFLANVITV